jgi:hypothetical protein
MVFDTRVGHFVLVETIILLKLDCFTQKLSIPNRMDPLWLAMSKLRRGKLDECVSICDEALAKNQNDQVGNIVIDECLSSSVALISINCSFS